MPTPTPPTPPRTSKLLPLGIPFMVVGFLGRPPLSKLAAGMDPSPMRGILFALATDGLTLLLVAGVTCALLGWLRNRRAQRNSG